MRFPARISPTAPPCELQASTTLTQGETVARVSEHAAERLERRRVQARRCHPESAFAGAAVVFEAKRDATYTVQEALDELDAARKNRDAAVGVFVMARSHASDVFPRFARYGNNVLVVWDDRDPTTDAYLHAAILLGIGLVTRTETAAHAAEGIFRSRRAGASKRW
jgi:hypothetical protein